MHYECELAVVIGKTARSVAARDAMTHVAGYTVANDYAIRDYLENWYRPNLRVKNRDACTPLGPWLVDAADVAARRSSRCARSSTAGRRSRATRATWSSTSPLLIEYLSGFMTLAPGDVILTGTPEGVVDVSRGDEVVTEIEGIGRARQHHRRRRRVRPRGRPIRAKGIRMRSTTSSTASRSPAASYFETVKPGDAGGAGRSGSRRRGRGRRRRRRRQGGLPGVGAACPRPSARG